MKKIIGKVIGDIHIVVCETPDGHKFFKLNANNQDILPILDTIEDTLSVY